MANLPLRSVLLYENFPSRTGEYTPSIFVTIQVAVRHVRLKGDSAAIVDFYLRTFFSYGATDQFQERGAVFALPVIVRFVTTTNIPWKCYWYSDR